MQDGGLGTLDASVVLHWLVPSVHSFAKSGSCMPRAAATSRRIRVNERVDRWCSFPTYDIETSSQLLQLTFYDCVLLDPWRHFSFTVFHTVATAFRHHLSHQPRRRLCGGLQVDTQVRAGWKGYLCQCCDRAATGGVNLDDIEDLAADRAEAEEAEAKRASEKARDSRAASSMGDGDAGQAVPAIAAVPEKAYKKFLGVELSQLSVAYSPRGTVRKKKGAPTPKQGVTLKFLQVCASQEIHTRVGTGCTAAVM